MQKASDVPSIRAELVMLEVQCQPFAMYSPLSMRMRRLSFGLVEERSLRRYVDKAQTVVRSMFMV